MVEVILGDYVLTDKDQLLGNFNTDILFKSIISTNKTFVLFAEDCGIDRKKLELIKDHARTEIKIITCDPNLIKNFRSSKIFKVTKNDTNEKAMNPFDLAKAVITSPDRQFIYDFLAGRKENIYMLIRVLTSNYSQLTEKNKRWTMFLDKYFNKCSNDILYCAIAFLFERQQSFWSKWSFPKKTEEKKEETH